MAVLIAKSAPITATAATLLLACTDAPPAAVDLPAGIALTHVARSGPLPYSASDAMAMMSADRACVLDSYDVAIVCGDRQWRDVVRIGREGRGPGELSAVGEMASGAAGEVLWLDVVTGRVVRVGGGAGVDGGGVVGEARLASRVTAAAELGDDGVLPGYNLFAGGVTPGASGLRLLTLSPASGDVGDGRLLELPADAGGSSDVVLLTGAVRLPAGRHVLRVNGPGLSRWAVFDDVGTFEYLLDEPPLQPGLPTARDVERFREQYQVALMGLVPVTDSMLRNFREQPLRPYPRQAVRRVVQEDDAGNLWVLTSRRAGDGTSVDVYRGPVRLGSVTLRGHVLGIQMRQGLLLALVEEDDGGVVPGRWLDWYEVGVW